MAETQYGMAIDTNRCVGCHTCAVACKVENGLADNTWWNRILTVGDGLDNPSGTFPDNSISFYPLACQHCANPACVKVCPVGATYKETDTGVVLQDYDKCIGCRMCIAACPYTGVRSFNWEEPKYSIGFATGDESAPAHLKHVVEKCNMCYHRVLRGEKPECVSACTQSARIWGDLNDPESEVSKLIASREHKQLLPEEGTKPSVYYLV